MSLNPAAVSACDDTPGIDAVVFDLDGVIRHWNDDALGEVESAHGLSPGAILAVAFSEELGPAAITGRLTYREWMDRIRTRIVADHGVVVEPALDVWEANVGTVDTEMLSVLRRVRTRAPVALLSNGTTRLRRDLHVLDLLDEFDTVFNTAELGIAKPDERVFRLVCRTLGTPPRRTAFLDDLERNVAGAAAIGMPARQHVSVPDTLDFLTSLGLLIDD